MRTEITDLTALREHRTAGHDLRDVVLVGLDLTGEDDLLRTALDGAVLLGCELSSKTRRQAEAAGALIFPAIPDLPYQVYRTTLYTPAELFAGFDPARPESYANTLDARVYQHSQEQGRTPDPLHALAERLHDHSITSALGETLAAHRNPAVAVMGGHALTRDSAGYLAAMRLGAALGRAGFTVLTGGGPGAMEAVPYGVRMPDHIDELHAELAKAPRFGEGAAAIGQWLAAGLACELPDSTPLTIGIPTWFYGHEPPNPACHWHAKYFANSVREDGLLTVATGGVVYTPGSAGTVQEVFQDYTQNHYKSVGPAAPMVFLDKGFWTTDVPAAPLVQQLARGRDAEQWILVTDDVDEAVALLQKYSAA
ncbi:LOG family protein [Kibdelosporangium aridum]|uniref:LOG family protein n=1 Tax=Kibdelosporangium aridum TaxID=2030 RepID=UPI0005251122